MQLPWWRSEKDILHLGFELSPPRGTVRGKVITCMGPLLIINLGISHLFLNWLPSPGAQEWLRTIGELACSTTNQMTLGKAFFRGERDICLGWFSVLSRSKKGSFHLKKNL